MQPGAHYRRAVLWWSAGAFSLALAFLAWRSLVPSDGTRLEPGELVRTTAGVSIALLDGANGGLRAGDVVAAVDGRSYESWALALFQPVVERPAWRSGETHIYRVLRDGAALDVPVTLAPFPFGALFGPHWGEFASRLIELGLIGFIVVRRPDSLPARLLFFWAVCGSCYSIIHALEYQVGDVVQAGGLWLYVAGGFTTIMLSLAALVHYATIFPRPLPVSSRGWLVPAIYGAPFVAFAAGLGALRVVTPQVLDWMRLWRPLSSVPILIYTVLFTLASIWQYREARREPVARQQLRPILFSMLVIVMVDLVFVRIPRLLLLPRIDPNLNSLVALLFPAALALAVLRYRLFDIDLIINRALVYGGLSLSIAGLYIGGVEGLSQVLRSDTGLFRSLLVTAAVAIVFQPLRERLQRGVNRLMYGDRDEPYAVLSRLGQRLDAALDPEAVLPTIVETVATALKLPYAAIALQRSPAADAPATPPVTTAEMDAGIVAAYGQPMAVGLRLPLTYLHETLGWLLLAPRAPDEPFSQTDLRLLADVARAAGAAAHAVRLSADLQRSRERLVTAREEERRRIRRDLHDGLGPALAALTLKLDAARNLVDQDAPASKALLGELRAQTQSAITDIRRLVYELRPPALDELGLTAALREYAARLSSNGLQIAIEAGSLPPLSAAAEVATYRIVTEALTNVVRHAHARHCLVRLSGGSVLTIAVSDDGVGLPPGMRAGVGLASMRERAEELGGTFAIESPGSGTRVTTQLPLNVPPSPRDAAAQTAHRSP